MKTPSWQSKQSRLGAAVAVAVLLISGVYFISRSGVASTVLCRQKLAGSMIFELPEEDMSLEEFRLAIDERTQGCGVVVVRQGPDRPDAMVEGQGTRYEINTSMREVYVNTS